MSLNPRTPVGERQQQRNNNATTTQQQRNNSATTKPTNTVRERYVRVFPVKEFKQNQCRQITA